MDNDTTMVEREVYSYVICPRKDTADSVSLKFCRECKAHKGFSETENVILCDMALV